MSAVDPHNEVTNALARIDIRLDIPREKLIELVGMPDDEDKAEGGWYQRACEAAQEWIELNEIEAIEQYAQESEVSCE
jgi:hypothetical protein